MKTYLFLLLLSVSIILPQAQTEEENTVLLPEGLGFSNQLKFSYDIDKELVIFEDWLNLDYRKGIFSSGIRLDIFQPNDPNPAVFRGKQRFADIAFKYIRVELGDIDEGLDITGGNYYALFGRGLILKSYEDRNVRIDNNLLGLKMNLYYHDLFITALSGMAENSSAERKEILHGLDVEYRGLDFLKLGGSFAANLPEDEKLAATRFTSLRVQPSFWNFDMYMEYGIKQNDDIKTSSLKDSSTIIGRGIYGNLSFYLDKFSISGEYKYYDNFAFISNDGTIVYNTPPAVRKEYSYTLLNRHPSPLDQSNEKGYLVEVNYSPDEETFFNIAYSETKTLSQNSLFQKINNLNQSERIQLRELFINGSKYWGDKFYSLAAVHYNEELSTNTKNITPILELKYFSDEINTFRFILEHQQSTNEATDEIYYDDVLTLEYLRSPKLSVSLVTELQTKEPEPNRIVRRVWSFIQFGYKFTEQISASILFGSRQAGNICIGGVCRYEPEFSGIELKMVTRI